MGSFAQGLFLVHSECLEAEGYVNARPFRVNAGPLCAYVMAPGGRTAYLSELRTGDQAGGVLKTSTRLTLNLPSSSAHIYEQGFIENKHSTDVASPPPPHVSMSGGVLRTSTQLTLSLFVFSARVYRILPQGMSCFEYGRVLIINDPATRC